MARRVTGLDLGAYSVKLVRLECGKQSPKFEILNVAEEILSVDDLETTDLVTRQRRALQRLVKQGLVEAEAYIVGLEPSAGQMRSMKVPFVDNRKIEAVLPGILDAELPFDIDDMIFSWHRNDAQAGSDNAHAKTKEGSDIRIAFGKRAAIASCLHVTQVVSIDPRIMHLTSAAPYELVRELGFQAFDRSNDIVMQDASRPLAAIIDFGHHATNLCIFNEHGLVLTRSFMRGGQELSTHIAEAFGVSFKEGEELKHHHLDLLKEPRDEQSQTIQRLGLHHFQTLFADISQTLIQANSSGLGQVASVCLVGGAVNTPSFLSFFTQKFADLSISVVPAEVFLPADASSPNTALACAYSLSGLQIHAKDSRFNFRKDEFAWRGELDFVRTKSVPLVLWGLTLVCLLVILWFAASMILEKENQYAENQLKNTCSQILGQKNVAAKKCLTLMKEQISSNTDLGIPDFTAADVYIKTAEFVPKTINLTITELDVLEKKVRINADTGSFEDVDKVVVAISAIPCFINVEKGRAQQVGTIVKFSLSADLDCNVSLSKAPVEPKLSPNIKQPRPSSKSVPENSKT